jgi:TRAP-type uncharacterized transport system fused permease subunit
MAVYTPALMLQDAGPMAAAWGYPVEVAYVFFKACFGIALWGIAVVGYLFARLSLPERLLAFVAGFSVVLALPWTDEFGFVVGGLLLAFHRWRARKAGPAAATP